MSGKDNLSNIPLKTQIWDMPVVQLLDRRRFILKEDFYFQSFILKTYCKIPTGFTTDFESVPIFRGTSPVSGLIHDYLVRKDSKPVVSKSTAADVYLEFLTYRNNSFIRRQIKSWAVRFWPGYFHKKYVLKGS